MAEPVYIETWEVVRNQKREILVIAYTKSMCPTVDALDAFRFGVAETHECLLKKLLKTRTIEFKIKKR